MTVPEPSWRRNSRAGYPFGARELVLKSTPTRRDADLGCTLHDGGGRQVGSVESVSAGPWNRIAQFLGNGAAASWTFVVQSADGVPCLNVARPRIRGWRDRHEQFLVHDTTGREVGRLAQNNGYLDAIRTFDLLSGETKIGHTTTEYRRVSGEPGENALHTVTIHDARGEAVGRIVQRRASTQLLGGTFYDYTMTYAHPPFEPMGNLCLTVLLSEYFHRRTEDGGTVANLSNLPTG